MRLPLSFTGDPVCLVFTCLPESSLCANVGVERDIRARLEVGKPDKPAHPGGL